VTDAERLSDIVEKLLRWRYLSSYPDAEHDVVWLAEKLGERNARIAELKARLRRNEWDSLASMNDHRGGCGTRSLPNERAHREDQPSGEGSTGFAVRTRPPKANSRTRSVCEGLVSSKLSDEAVSGFVRQPHPRLRVNDGPIISHQGHVSGLCGIWVYVRDIKGDDNDGLLCENGSGPTAQQNATAYSHGKK
jgi:hypothetical protein